MYAVAMTGQPDEPMARLWINQLTSLNPTLPSLSCIFSIHQPQDGDLALSTVVVHESETQLKVDPGNLEWKNTVHEQPSKLPPRT